jgi:peroxiredoxin (alkyl hydroperoxide reductase subunit C)
MKKSVVLLSALLVISFSTFAQSKKFAMPIIGEEAPKFSANSTNGMFKFPQDFGDSWKIIFSHPKDFTPVCSSELLELAHKQDQFKELNTELIVLSTDILQQHKDWKLALEEISYKNNDPIKIEFPLVDDSHLLISRKYGMLHEPYSDGRDVRAVFIIDPDNIVRSIQYYPTEVGRNIDEILRSVHALQTVAENENVLTPANWQPGNHVLIPHLDSDDKEKLADKNNKDVYQEAWFMTYKKLNSK